MNTVIQLEKLYSKYPKTKYGYAKELLYICSTQPEVLYNYFEEFKKLLSEKNKILKWSGIDLMGYLAVVDKENKTESIIGTLIELLHGGNLITCNHAIFALGKIAESKPEKSMDILHELIQITNDQFDTLECKNIAVGKVIEALFPFENKIKKDEKIIRFIKAAAENDRNSTKQKAFRLLKKLKI